MNGDGVLDADELAKRSAARAHAANETRVMDKNKDGLVDEKEFLCIAGGESNEGVYRQLRAGPPGQLGQGS